MKIILSVLVLSASLFASNDYIPLSDFTKEQKKEYKFVKTYNNSPKIVYKIESTMPKKEKSRINRYYNNKIKSPTNRSALILKNTKAENTNSYYEPKNKRKRDISFVAELSYNFLNGKINSTKLDDSKTVMPKIYLNVDQHTVIAKYLKNKFDNYDIENVIYSIGYRYNININNNLSANVGLDFNYFEVENSLKEKENEYYPSFEFDLNHNLGDIFKLSYGAGIGSNGDGMKYAYNYFLDLETSPQLLNNRISFLAGYKGKEFSDKNKDKFQLNGPFIGLKAFF